jgi:hypothetical protein
MSLIGPTGRRWRVAAALLVVVAAVLCKHHPFLSAGGSLIGHDWYHTHQLDAVHVQRAAAQGSPLPFWTPWIQAGTELYAVPTKPFAYLPFLIGVLALGPYLGMNLLLIAHVLLACLGTLLLVRRLGMGLFAATVGALLLALTVKPVTAFVSAPFGFGYAVAWWPYAVLCVLDVLERHRPRRAGVLLGVLLALQLHAGGELSLYWLACFLAAFCVPFLARRWSAPALKDTLAAAALAALVFLGLAAVKLWPELRWLASSGRSEPADPQWALDGMFELRHAQLGSGSRLVTLAHVLAELYAGKGWITLGLGLAVGVVVAVRRRAGLGILLGTLVCLVIASGLLHGWLFDVLPGYDRMRKPTRFLNMAGFGAILLAAYGVDALWTGLSRVAPRLLAPAAALLVALLLLETHSVPVLGYAGPELLPVAERLALAAQIYAPAVRDPGRFRIHEHGYEEQADWLALGLESTTGAVGGPGSANRRYEEWLQPRMSVVRQEQENRFILDALNARYSVSAKPLSGEHLELLQRPVDLDPENQRFGELLLVRPFVYRRSTALARASLADDPVLVVGEEEARRRALEAAMHAPGVCATGQVFVEDLRGDGGDLGPADAAGFGAVLFAGRSPDDPVPRAWRERVGRGRLTALPPFGTFWSEREPLAPERVEPLADERVHEGMGSIDVDLEGLAGGFLLLSELLSVHPGWTGTIDGRPAELLTADGLITAVRLPPGARRARFRFLPPGFVAGASVTGLTLLALGAAGIAAARRGRRT